MLAGADRPEDPLAVAQQVAARMMREDRVAPALGIELEDVGPGRASVGMVVADSMLNGVGIVHGGYIFLLADCAFAIACNSHGETTVSRSCEIEYLRPAHVGDRLLATASERRRIGRRGIYDVLVSDGRGRAVAEFRGHSSGLRASAD